MSSIQMMMEYMMKVQLFTCVSFFCATAAFSSPPVKPVRLEFCDERSGATIANLLSGPKNQKSLMSDRVSLFQFDRGEPAASAAGVAIAFEAQDEARADAPDRRCVAVSGLANAHLGQARVAPRTLPGTKFLVTIPVTVFEPSRGDEVTAQLEIRGIQVQGKHGTLEMGIQASLRE